MARLELLMFTFCIAMTSVGMTFASLGSHKSIGEPHELTKAEVARSKLESATSIAQSITNKTSPAINLNSKQANNSRVWLTEASLLRPSFIKGLIGSRHRPGKQPDEEMEEVTQTIVVPMSQSIGSGPSNKGARRSRSKSQRSSRGSGQFQNVLHEGHQEGGVPTTTSSNGGINRAGVKNPLAEASLQLTSTEIGGLLNDREAPEFYRERELSGDGVLVGEEPATSRATSAARLGSAASGPLGTQYMGDYGPGLGAGLGGGGPSEGFEGGENAAAAIYRQRLMQAASEEGYGGGGGFNHRFGRQSFGTGEELGMDGGGQVGGEGSGLMQAPNEFNQVNAYHPGFGGDGGFAGAPSQYQGTGAGDYSPNSGLLRAGSEGPFTGSFGQSMMGNGPGSGEFSATAMGDFSGGHNSFYGNQGRLQAHASYNPYQTATNDGDYASRFGYQGPGLAGASLGYGLDQRGFASHNNHQIMTQRLNQAASSQGGGRLQGSRLMPLTPVVPLAEELAGNGVTQPSVMSSNQRDHVIPSHSSAAKSQHHSMNAAGFQQQIHEALEDDPTNVSQADETTETAGEHNFDNNLDGPSLTNDLSGIMTSAMSKRDQVSKSGMSSNFPSSFVLNVPPPSSEQHHSPGSNFRRGAGGLSQQQMVEFSRVGSAGYLAPNHLDRSMMLTRKFGRHHRNQPSNSDDSDQSPDDGEPTPTDEESSSSVASSTEVDNPAHAGKYIID